MKTILTLSLLLQACGTQEQPTTTSSRTEEPKTSVVQVDASDIPSYALVVSALKNAPECNAIKKYVLVYVKEDAKFYNCNGSNYETVDIKGAKGDQGLAGSKGDTGAQGTAGTNGTNGVDGAPTPSNVWYDPVTGNTWLIGGLHGNYLGYQNTCAGQNGYRAATRTETHTAQAHGIWSKVMTQTSTIYAWQNDDSTYVVDLQSSGAITKVNGTAYVILCIK